MFLWLVLGAYTYIIADPFLNIIWIRSHYIRKLVIKKIVCRELLDKALKSKFKNHNEKKRKRNLNKSLCRDGGTYP